MIVLTIGIPTYNRVSKLLQNLEKIDLNQLSSYINILVIDNSSKDRTYETLISKYGMCNQIKIIRNQENIGFSLNLINLFKNTKSKYIFLLSDEDFINVEKLNRFLLFLDEKKPDIVASSINIESGEKYKDFRKTTYLKLCDVESSFGYMSGIVFNVSKSKNYIGFIKDGIKNKNIYSQLYPQVLLAQMMFNKKSAYVYSEELCTRYEEPLETYPDVNNYWVFSSRWEQLKAHADFLVNVEKKSDVSFKTVEYLIQSKMDNIFNVMTSAFLDEKPILLNYFKRTLRKVYLLKIRGLFSSIINRLFR